MTFYKAIPKTRPAIGVVVLQFALLFIAQVIYHFTHSVASEREPVLSYIYKAHQHTFLPNFGGGLIGFYLLKLFVPLISIFGVIIITLLLLASSIILLSKRRHRDVSKALLEGMKTKSQSASENMKDRRQARKVKKMRKHV